MLNMKESLQPFFLMREVTSALLPLLFSGCGVIIHTRHVSFIK